MNADADFVKHSIFYPWQRMDAVRFVKPLLIQRAKILRDSQIILDIQDLRIKERLSRSLPSAILLYGCEGIGKFRFAMALCQTLLCNVTDHLIDTDSYACEHCQDCRWFIESTHPDFHLIMPGKRFDSQYEGKVNVKGRKQDSGSMFMSNEIKVEQVRELMDVIRISPQCSNVRIIMIYSADNLNDVAANMLLKIMEEPPPYLVFVLVAKHPTLLIPTIVSRCVRIPLTYPDRATVCDWLIVEKNIPLAERVIASSGGAPLRALKEAELLASGDFYHLILAQLAKGPNMDVRVCTEAFCNFSFKDALRLLQCWVIDLMSRLVRDQNIKSSDDDEISHLHTYSAIKRLRYFLAYNDRLSNLVTRVDKISLGEFYQKITQMQSIASHSINIQFAIEKLLHEYVEQFV